MKRLLVLAVILSVGCATKEATFMNVCPKGSTFHYPLGLDSSSLACDKPVSPRWKKLPLTIMLDPQMERYRESFEYAVRFWNRELGKPAFQIVDQGAFQVTIARGESSTNATQHNLVDGELKATVWYGSQSDTAHAYYVFAHEMGHVLWLAHDASERSVMFPRVNYDPFSSEGFPVMLLSSRDKKALRSLYYP